ncbi:MAG TPA: hypothetical protein VIV12_20915, partial [Streptosporangiaceae bacterium]
MTTPAGNSHPSSLSTPDSDSPVTDMIRLVPGPGSPDHRPDRSPGGPVHSPAGPNTGRAVRPWPLLLLAMPAAVAVWSGWVGIGQLTGFGQVHPLPGLWPGFRIDTAVTLPVGVEAYAAYALHAWLTANNQVSARTRAFARRSAIGSLLLGMAGQIAYHLLAQAHATRAPWPITTAVSCLPVLVLGMGAALAQLIRADTHCSAFNGQAEPPGPDQPTDHEDHGRMGTTIRPDRLADAKATAARLNAGGQRISRRALRSA